MFVFRRMATLVEPTERIILVTANDDDNRILECAVAARATTSRQAIRSTYFQSGPLAPRKSSRPPRDSNWDSFGRQISFACGGSA